MKRAKSKPWIGRNQSCLFVRVCPNVKLTTMSGMAPQLYSQLWTLPQARSLAMPAAEITRKLTDSLDRHSALTLTVAPKRYTAAVRALADPLSTRLVLVARAQRAALREAERTQAELGAIGLARQYLVINGVYPSSQIAGDPLAQAVVEREQQALAAMPAEAA